MHGIIWLSKQKNLSKMGRNKLNDETVLNNYDECESLLKELIEQRQTIPIGEERNNLIKRISSVSSRMSYLRKNFPHLLKKNENEGKKPIISLRTEFQINQKKRFQLVEEKANSLLQEAKTEEEKKSIMERLYYCKLRYKYAY